MNGLASIIDTDSREVVEACRDVFDVMAGQTLLLTGATGFIGRTLLDALAAYNRAVRTPIRLFLPTRSPARAIALPGMPSGEAWACWFEWDGVRLPPAPDGPCDFIIHAASPVDPALIGRDPVGSAQDMVAATAAVVEFARHRQAGRLLQISSGAVYGAQPPGLSCMPETFRGGPDLSNPRAAYAEAKRYSEFLCHAGGVPATAARLFACIGPRQSLAAEFAFPDFVRRALQGGPIRIRGDGTALRTFCYATDVASALFKLLLAADPAFQVCNVGAEEPVVSIGSLADMIAAAVPGTGIVIEGRASGAPPERYVPDISLLKTLYIPRVSLDEGIRRVLAAHGEPLQELARLAAGQVMA